MRVLCIRQANARCQIKIGDESFIAIYSHFYILLRRHQKSAAGMYCMQLLNTALENHENHRRNQSEQTISIT